MKKAVFLDRDGTLIALSGTAGRLTDIKHMRLLPGAARAVRMLNDAGFLVIMHTNQTVIGWGQVSENELTHMHEILCKRLRTQGAHIDAIYYCPHHPDAPLKKYRKICQCRKPEIGMLRDAMEKYQIDVNQSFMVGDSSKDILTGKRAGLHSILVKTGNAGMENAGVSVEPEHIAKNLLSAALYIKKAHNAKAVREAAGS